MHESAVNRIVALLMAEQKDQISAGEQAELQTWIKTSEANQVFIERCRDLNSIADSLCQLEAIEETAAFQQFSTKNSINQVNIVPFQKKIYRWVAAAILLGIIGTGAFIWLVKVEHQKVQTIAVVNKGENIQPGFSQATLTLGDGRTIKLNDSENGVLVQEGGAVINKQGGKLIYAPIVTTTPAKKNKVILYNTVTTPRGGNYELTLPDKTKVWLNAEASIRYPTIFIENERKVEITGEAYFEVAKKASQPFIITVYKAQVKVLGTHFNIRAYEEDEATKITLLEGSVLVSIGDNHTLAATLKPGEQAIVQKSLQFSGLPQIGIVDVENVIAWKTGYFDFKSTPFPQIMQELKRWYVGIEVDIKEPVNERLTATIPRNVPLSTMLTILEATGKVHFEVKDKTIIVTQ